MSSLSTNNIKWVLPPLQILRYTILHNKHIILFATSTKEVQSRLNKNTPKKLEEKEMQIWIKHSATIPIETIAKL